MMERPGAVGVHVYVQFSRPLAGCHVVPPSTDTSTPAITPKRGVAPPGSPTPKSIADPLIVIGDPTFGGAETARLMTAGGVASPDAVATTTPGRRLPG